MRHGQRALFELLRQNVGKNVTEGDILVATGWSAESWHVYCTNGLYADFIEEGQKGVFKVTLDGAVTDKQFERRVSQSRKNSPFKHALTTTLVRRSADNFALALECYNRPTLGHRVDVFALLAVTAWEQLLKAIRIERSGEPSIFEPKRQGHRLESISLRKCIEAQFPIAKDPVRMNLEHVAELRNQAAHLAVPHLQAHHARLFQACVFNYSRQYRDFCGESPLPTHNVGLLALASEPEQLNAVALSKLYGQIASQEILDHATRVRDLVAEVNDDRFSIPFDYTLTFARKGREGDVQLVQASSAPLDAVVIFKPVNDELTHPLTRKQLAAKIEEALPAFSFHDLLAVLKKENWNSTDSAYHTQRKNPDCDKYSVAVADEIVRLVGLDSDYLARCRKSYSSANAQAAKASRLAKTAQRRK